MRKNIIKVCVVIIGIILCIAVLINNNIIGTKIIYQNAFFFDMGSRKIKIYDNGKVYDDLQIEEPNHKTNYKLIKRLAGDEIQELKEILEKESKEELDNHIKRLIYGTTDLNNPATWNIN